MTQMRLWVWTDISDIEYQRVQSMGKEILEFYCRRIRSIYRSPDGFYTAMNSKMITSTMIRNHSTNCAQEWYRITSLSGGFGTSPVIAGWLGIDQDTSNNHRSRSWRFPGCLIRHYRTSIPCRSEPEKPLLYKPCPLIKSTVSPRVEFSFELQLNR